MKIYTLVLSFAVILATGVAQGQVNLIKDINTGAGDGWPEQFTVVNDILYFVADDGTHGEELWRTDGTAEGTAMVKDIADGNASSNLEYITDVNGTLFFIANDGVNGEALWKSNGTPESTVMVKDIVATGSADIEELVNLNGVLYFVADDGNNGDEIWRSDGTEAGTMMAVEIIAGPDSSEPQRLTVSNSALFFSAYEDNYEAVFCKTDGTQGGTVRLNETSAGISYIDYVTDVNGVVYFTAYTDVAGLELWKSDGTLAGTAMLKDINPGENMTYFQEFEPVGDVLFFTADNYTEGLELWKSDGTAEGTTIVKDLWPGANASNPRGLTAANGLLFFIPGSIPSAEYEELWQSDGTAAGTKITRKIATSYFSSPNYLSVAGNVLYFYALDDTGEYQIWRTDGTYCKTYALTSDQQDINIITSFVPLGGKLLFSGNLIESNLGHELYSHDMAGDGDNTKTCQSITFAALEAKTYGDSELLLTATSDSGLPINYNSDDPSVVSIDGNAATILKAGTVTITASQPGNTSYLPAVVAQRLVVNKADLTVKADDKTRQFLYDNPELTITYTGFKGSDNIDVLDSHPQVYTYIGGATLPGEYDIYLQGGEDDNYNYVLTDGVITVTKAIQVIDFPAMADKTLGDEPFMPYFDSNLGHPFFTVSSASDKVTIDAYTITMLKPGRATIKVELAGNNMLADAEPVEQSFCINPARPSIVTEGINTAEATLISSSATGNQWYRNDLPVEGADQSTLAVHQQGVYTVTVRQDDCQSVHSDPVTLLITSAEEPVNNTIAVFPNPAVNTLSVQFKKPSHKIASIRVMDTKGVTKEVISSAGEPETTLDIAAYTPGVYVLELHTEAGVFHKTFIKK